MRWIWALVLLVGISAIAVAQAPQAPTMGQQKHAQAVAKVKPVQHAVGTAAAGTHSVVLSWNNPAAPPTITGNNVYRGTVSGGPYGKIFTGASPITTYTDSTVSGGTTYYYVVTAVCSSCNPTESAFSNQVQAAVPQDQPAPPSQLTVTSVN